MSEEPSFYDDAPYGVGYRCTGKHYTDDGEFTACAGYPLEDLPDGEELVDALDEVTCLGCKAILAIATKVSTREIPPLPLEHWEREAMGYWVNLDSDMSRVHKEGCEYVNPQPKTEGGWHYAQTPADVHQILGGRTRWKPCKCCKPQLDT